MHFSNFFSIDTGPKPLIFSRESDNSLALVELILGRYEIFCRDEDYCRILPGRILHIYPRISVPRARNLSHSPQNIRGFGPVRGAFFQLFFSIKVPFSNLFSIEVPFSNFFFYRGAFFQLFFLLRCLFPTFSFLRGAFFQLFFLRCAFFQIFFLMRCLFPTIFSIGVPFSNFFSIEMPFSNTFYLERCLFPIFFPGKWS